MDGRMHLYFSLRYIIAIVNPPIIIDLCLLDLFIKHIAYKKPGTQTDSV